MNDYDRDLLQYSPDPSLLKDWYKNPCAPLSRPIRLILETCKKNYYGEACYTVAYVMRNV